MIYMLFMFIIDIISRICGYYGSNLLVLLIYSFFELILFSVFYFKFLYNNKHRILASISLIALLYIIFEIIVIKQIKAMEFQSYAKVLDNLVIIYMALVFFYERINIYKESKWDNFGLNAVILVFFSINLIFFLPINFLINETSGLNHYFWISNLVITVAFYSYLTHSIWKNGRTRRLLLSGSR